MNPSSNSDALSRRRFLHHGVGGATLLLGWLPSRAEAASARDNPFNYNIDRYRKVDPKWLHYEKTASFDSPRPDPRRIAIDRQDRLYLASGRTVVVLDRQGIPSAEILCDAPVRCVSVAADGVRYLGFKDHIEAFDAKGQRTARWEAVTGRPFLTGLAAGENDLFAADAGNRVILRYDRSGKLLGRIGERNPDRNIPGLIVPSACLDVEIGADGLLRVNNPGRHRVETYTFAGDLELVWGRASAAIDGFCGCCNPVNLELLPDGRCVTFEKGLPRVKIYSPTGQLESVVAGPDQFSDAGAVSPALDSEGSPAGVLDGAIDSQGRIYALDLPSRRVDILQRKPDPAPAAVKPASS
ncbi:MAG: hypothetical protein KJ072_18460 [Verrucomicrobia bacterium]|nr:hypothetical protein [Verrucomicrobiota bacterium]